MSSRAASNSAIDASATSEDTLRVAHVMLGLNSGGAEQLVVQSVIAHADPGVSIKILVLDPRRLSLASMYTAAGGALEVAPDGVLRTLVWLRTIIRSSDVLHTHAPSVSVAVRLVLRSLAPKTRPSLVHTEHNLWSSHRVITRTANRLTLPMVDQTVAVSAPVSESMRGRGAQRPLVHRHGISTDGLRSRIDATNRKTQRETLAIEPSRLVVLTVANPRPQKAYDVLLEAFVCPVVAQHAPVLLAVGHGPDLERLRDQVRQDGFEGQIRFLGPRDDVPALLAIADVFVLASHTEGLPVALMEAAVAGLPRIGTAVGGVPDLIDDDATGLLVPRGDAPALAEALDRLLADATLRSRLGDAALLDGSQTDARATARWYSALYRRIRAEARFNDS